MMAKALLLARFYILNDAEFEVPPLFLIPREPVEEINWEKFEELVKNPSAIAGLAILELGQRTQFWFKDGPGDEGSTQQSMVKATLAELITVASQRNGRGSFAFSDAWILNKDVDYSNTVFFYAIDARYADIIQEMGKLVYREPPGRQYVFPPDVVVDEESTKLGVEWTSETGEEFMLDTICPQDLVKMRKHLYVNYDPGYVQNVISKEPFITMSRVARSTTSVDPLSSQNGLAISWCLTHLNLSVGLTTTPGLPSSWDWHTSMPVSWTGATRLVQRTRQRVSRKVYTALLCVFDEFGES
ncbi:hypothetical protein BC829DRAFT_30615 [Chytridium lagenaria]|nr:hypothetical protein BC829DRAFT_30615 [Chytridium lagenaria]